MSELSVRSYRASSGQSPAPELRTAGTQWLRYESAKYPLDQRRIGNALDDATKHDLPARDMLLLGCVGSEFTRRFRSLVHLANSIPVPAYASRRSWGALTTAPA
jgi:hypothetical protein